MAELAYVSWGLMPVDADPLTGSPGQTRPPMMTAVAVDRGGSLVFELAPHRGNVTLRLETTALSAEGREAACFEVYTGTAQNYRSVAPVHWEKTTEGMSGIFNCSLTGVGSHLKLLSSTGDNLIVTGASFGMP